MYPVESSTSTKSSLHPFSVNSKTFTGKASKNSCAITKAGSLPRIL